MYAPSQQFYCENISYASSICVVVLPTNDSIVDREMIIFDSASDGTILTEMRCVMNIKFGHPKNHHLICVAYAQFPPIFASYVRRE